MFKVIFASTPNKVRFRSPFLKVLCISSISAALFLPSLQVSAQDEDTVESLKAKIASMEKQFAAVTKDRDSLYEQLSSTIDEIEALETKNADINTGRNHIRERYFALSEKSSAQEEETNRLVQS